MKVLVLLSLVALALSTPISVDKRVTVREDGTITIIGTQGREVDIYSSIIDPRKINIILKSQYGPDRKIEVDETDNIENVDFDILDARFFKNIPRTQITQADILTSIFRKYEGVVPEQTYRTLLEKIQTLVNAGVLRTPILEALKTLDHLYMVEELNKVEETKNVMDNIVRENLMRKDVLYPEERISQVQHISDVVPVEGLVGFNRYRNVLPVQELVRTEELLNNKNLISKQHLQMLLQTIKQQPQYQQGLEEEILSKELLGEQELTQQQIMQQLYQHQREQFYKQQLEQYQMTPLNRFLYNTGVLGKQQVYGYPYTRQQIVPYQMAQELEQVLNQGKQQWVHQQAYPQQWVNQQVYPQKYAHQQVYPQQWVNQQEYPKQWAHQQVYPQQYSHQEVYPQQWAHKQVYPQQYSHQQVYPQQWARQQELVY